MLQAAAAATGAELSKVETIIQRLIDWGINAGERIIGAIIVFVVGRFIISFLNKLINKLLSKRKIDPSIKTFVRSLSNILLTILLIVAVVSKLGVETTSFAALLASAGVAIGMALSGNLQNFAGGLIVLLLRPYKVGDLIESQGITGTVREIQIFHTILTTADNKVIYIPNGALSSGTVTNYSREATRRIEWIVGVEYGEDFEKVKKTIEDILAADGRILTDPAPTIALHARMGESRRLLGCILQHQQADIRRVQPRRHRLPLPATDDSSSKGLRIALTYPLQNRKAASPTTQCTESGHFYTNL